MILIFSNSFELGVNKVLDWLILWNQPFIRINEFTEVEIIELTLYSSNEQELEYILRVGETEIKYSQIKSVWFRQANKINFILNYSNINGSVKN